MLFYYLLLPFIQYIFGFIGAVIARIVTQNKLVFLVGWTAVSISALLIYYLNYLPLSASIIVGVFSLFGLGGNMMVCASLGFVAQLIGRNHDNAAFVFASNSFFDKIFSGLIVFVLNSFNAPESLILSYGAVVFTSLALPSILFFK